MLKLTRRKGVSYVLNEMGTLSCWLLAAVQEVAELCDIGSERVKMPGNPWGHTKKISIKKDIWYKVLNVHTVHEVHEYIFIFLCFRWGITSHGCIDGYSWLVVYLQASANNRASTVFNLFVNATVPTCEVRPWWWEQKCSTVHIVSGSERHLTGRSVHNQRIERLWRDVHERVISTCTFYATFYDLEDRGLLDINNANHLIALQVVYIPEVNRRLHSFQSAWNKHGIRTEGNKIPEELWMAGALEHSSQDYSAIQGIFSETGAPSENRKCSSGVWSCIIKSVLIWWSVVYWRKLSFVRRENATHTSAGHLHGAEGPSNQVISGKQLTTFFVS